MKPIKWTKEKCLKSALRYKTKTEWRLSDPRAHNSSFRFGKTFFKQCCSHMTPLYNYYPKDKIIKIAKKYKNLAEFRLKNKNAYEAACRLKITHSDLSFLKRGKTYKSIGEESVRLVLNKIFKSKFISSRPEWLINPNTGYRLELDGYNKRLNIAFEYQSAYHLLENILQKDKIKQQICSQKNIKLIIIPRDIMRDKNPQKSLEEILKSEFIRLNIKIKIPNFNLVIFNHDFSKNSKINIKKIARKYTTKKDFRKNHSEYYRKALKHGFLEEICSHMEGHHVNNYWNFETISTVAKLYQTKKEFYKNEGGAYSAAYSLGILNEVCSHMKTINRWTKDKILKASSKYPSLREIRLTNTMLYSSIVRWSLLKEVNELLN